MTKLIEKPMKDEINIEEKEVKCRDTETLRHLEEREVGNEREKYVQQRRMAKGGRFKRQCC